MNLCLIEEVTPTSTQPLQETTLRAYPACFQTSLGTCTIIFAANIEYPRSQNSLILKYTSMRKTSQNLSLRVEMPQKAS